MATCQTCDGKQFVRLIPPGSKMVPAYWFDRRADHNVISCPQCHGTGIESCCDGPVGGPGETGNGGEL